MNDAPRFELDPNDPERKICVKPPGALFRVRWFRAVLDEAGVVKNRRGQTSKAIAALLAERRW
jgi:SNF2 family DNA or RNA helicase